MDFLYPMYAEFSREAVLLNTMQLLLYDIPFVFQGKGIYMTGPGRSMREGFEIFLRRERSNI